MVVRSGDFSPGFTVLENFESYPSSAFPTTWRRAKDDARLIYRVETENDNHFLRARADNQAIQIGLEHVFDPRSQRRLTGAGACLSFQPAPTNEAVSANCRRELQGRVLQSYIRR